MVAIKSIQKLVKRVADVKRSGPPYQQLTGDNLLIDIWHVFFEVTFFKDIFID